MHFHSSFLLQLSVHTTASSHTGDFSEPGVGSRVGFRGMWDLYFTNVTLVNVLGCRCVRTQCLFLHSKDGRVTAVTSFPVTKPPFSARRSRRHWEHRVNCCNRWFCNCQATNIHLPWPFQNLCVNLGIWWFQLRKINKCALVAESSKVGSRAAQSLRRFCLRCVVFILLYRAVPSTLQVLLFSDSCAQPSL